MIPYKIFPVFEIGPFHINMYGIMFSLAVIVAYVLAIKEAKKRNIEKKIIEELIFYLLIGSIIGARIFYIMFHWPDSIPLTLFEAIAIWKGGLAFFGGILGALAAGYIFIRKKKLNFWILADILAIPIVVAHILGRLGDYLTGGHPGKVTSLPWGIFIEGTVRHPVVLYEIVGLIIILVILLNLKKIQSKLNLFNGFVFSGYIILYSVQRIILDFFRLESSEDPRFLGLTPTQYLSIVLFILLIAFISISIKKNILTKKNDKKY